MPNIAFEMFGDMRCLTPEENEKKLNMYRKISEPIYIGREEVLRHKRKMRDFDLCEEFWDEAVRCEDIENIPAADVAKVKYGKWILLDECANEGVYCSICHKKVFKKHYANQKLKSKFCPNCGAKMGEDIECL